MSGVNFVTVAIDSTDFDLFARYPTSRPYGDVSLEDKQHFKVLRQKLKSIAGTAAQSYSKSVPMKELASHTNPNGRSATDLWSCIYPSAVPNKSFGLQFALILNRSGAEICFCLGAGTSQVAGHEAAQTNSAALARTKERLAAIDAVVLDETISRIGADWDYRKQWRMPAGTKDFSDPRSWIAYASSPGSSGASISKNLTISEVEELGSRLLEEFRRWSEIFRPLFEAVYADIKPIATKPPESDAAVDTWIFQSNPNLHDLPSMLAHKSEFSWLVNQYADRMHVGDTVFLWEAGANAGILAIATILSLPAMIEEEADEASFNLVGEKFAGKHLRVRLRVTKVLEHRLLRKQLLEISELSGLSILRFANNTNFVVRDDEREAILSLIEDGGVTSPNSMHLEGPELQKAAPDYGVDDIIADGCFLPRATIDRMLGSLAAKKNVILQGPPGTGKTWLAKRLAFALIGHKDELKVRAVQFHPNLSYEDFVRGWRPTSSGKLSLVDGLFMEMKDAALAEPSANFVVVIEEINRGNPANIFGELLTLLEDEKRSAKYSLHLAYPDPDGVRRPVHLPENLFVIGTMNIADRSLALVDLAFRRRFAFIDLEPSFGDAWRNWLVEKRNVDAELVSDIERRVRELNEHISGDARLGKQFRIGHSYATPTRSLDTGSTHEWFANVVRTEIAPLLEEYWFDAPEEAQTAASKLLHGW